MVSCSLRARAQSYSSRKKASCSRSDGDYNPIRSVLTKSLGQTNVLINLLVLQKIEHFVRKHSGTKYFQLELDIPVQIQYVVGNMFRFSLNHRENNRIREKVEESNLRPENFSSFFLTKATKTTYFVLVFLTIPAIPATGGMREGWLLAEERYQGSLFLGREFIIIIHF